MNKLALYKIVVVAGEAEFRGLAEELKLVGRLMGAVAACTLTVLNRGVYVLHGVLRVVTFVTEFRALSYRAEFMFTHFFMTCRTFIIAYRCMYKFILAHFGMTL